MMQFVGNNCTKLVLNHSLISVFWGLLHKLGLCLLINGMEAIGFEQSRVQWRTPKKKKNGRSWPGEVNQRLRENSWTWGRSGCRRLMSEAKTLGFVYERIGLPYTSHLPYTTKNRTNIRNDFQTLNSDQHDTKAERVRTKEASPWTTSGSPWRSGI